ncbi:MAG: UPF0175 family protein [Dehalococcoidia bacterium]
MKTATVDVPVDLLKLLDQSRLGNRSVSEQVGLALAIHLFQEGIISVGRAAELAGQPRAPFELLLGAMGIPPVRYEKEDYDREWQTIQRAQQRLS